VVTVYKVAIIRKIEGDGINIRSHINYSNIKVVEKVFKREVIIE